MDDGDKFKGAGQGMRLGSAPSSFAPPAWVRSLRGGHFLDDDGYEMQGEQVQLGAGSADDPIDVAESPNPNQVRPPIPAYMDRLIGGPNVYGDEIKAANHRQVAGCITETRNLHTTAASWLLKLDHPYAAKFKGAVENFCEDIGMFIATQDSEYLETLSDEALDSKITLLTETHMQHWLPQWQNLNANKTVYIGDTTAKLIKETCELDETDVFGPAGEERPKKHDVSNDQAEAEAEAEEEDEAESEDEDEDDSSDSSSGSDSSSRSSSKHGKKKKRVPPPKRHKGASKGASSKDDEAPSGKRAFG